ncbi:MAG: hypothetical protein EOP42_06080 [Sphingobacteriaceae bacterium]|nr:MAG: hypothetical protein EOP42_06080 [Sphingobacteriaceae bacterium]
MSLSFFKDFGWEAEVVCVDECYSDLPKDELLQQSLPPDCIIHKVKAFSKKWTSKFGLGSLALRSMWYYRKEVMLLLQAKKFPYLIDMQDAWHSEYYQDKPKKDRPRKYWFSYRLHRFLEPLAMQTCDGLISVSQAYIDTLQQRYPPLKTKPNAVIPFGAFEEDFEIARNYYTHCQPAIQPKTDKIQVVYVGRGGKDMQQSIKLVFKVLKEALQTDFETYNRLHFYFIGTSYAPKELAEATIYPIAVTLGVENQVTEITDRIGFYSTINTLLAADALLIPGSDDPEYTASKIYPYLLAEKPLLAILHQKSSAAKLIVSCSLQSVVATFPDQQENQQQKIRETLNFWANFSTTKNPVNRKNFQEFTAKQMTAKQVSIFEAITKR